MSKEDVSITYENNIFYCTKNNTKWISVDGEKWYVEEKRIKELENKIADIKANCDLAIEGRDVKIKELELELTVEKDLHQEEINLHLHAEEYIKSLEKENAELKEHHKSVCETLTNTHRSLREQLTKAKEIIKNILNVCCSNCTNPHCVDCKHRKIVLNAEQFLKGENIILEDVQAGNSPFDADEVFNKEIKAYPEEK